MVVHNGNGMASCLEDPEQTDFSSWKEVTAVEVIETHEIMSTIKIGCYTKSQGTSCEIFRH